MDQKYKADAGKSDPTLFDEGFPLARKFIQATLDYGAQKYEAHSWRNVPHAFMRYAKAAARHRQARMEEKLLLQFNSNIEAFLRSTDDESGLPHVAHELFNLMAQLELAIAELNLSPAEIENLLRFNPPPQDHKK